MEPNFNDRCVGICPSCGEKIYEEWINDDREYGHNDDICDFNGLISDEG